jgi:Secretion system C-terminal sorting domain
MKKILVSLAILCITMQAKSQVLNPTSWCINSAVQVLTDSNGVHYTNVTLYNNDTALSNAYHFIAIEGLISSSNDTIFSPQPLLIYQHSEYINNDTSVTLRIDTSMSLWVFTSVLVAELQATWGMPVQSHMAVGNFCGSNPLGISHEKVDDLLIYPNPTHGEIFMEGKEDSNLKIVSMDGKIVFNQGVKAKTKIDISYLAKGIYLVQINDKYAQKLVVE